ncbi:MAG: tRNA (adenosine(37)-N6)-threonylcarbamoyltransferase complex dimerization subunit type 1 TsaB [Gemmatimonadaceae bacterium]|nr:tRNA (adenosine(37)-N6)-threonylcarbamoyltransferase complex dimerization subunit type 1 TsaB [Gloeobacterales cyanobacterium ES-bin-141]
MPTKKLWSLGLHTTTDTLALGVFQAEHLRTASWVEGRELARVLQSRLQNFTNGLAWADLGWVAVCVGPGSFTGMRLGVMAARTLGQGLEVPVLGVSALAAHAEAQVSTGPVAVWLEARRGERYGAVFNHQPQELTVVRPDSLVMPSDWERWISELPEGCQLLDGNLNEPPIEAMMRLADRRYRQGVRTHWSEVQPFYGQAPPIHAGALQSSPDTTHLTR